MCRSLELLGLERKETRMKAIMKVMFQVGVVVGVTGHCSKSRKNSNKPGLPAACQFWTLDAQPKERFVLGGTYWMPWRKMDAALSNPENVNGSRGQGLPGGEANLPIQEGNVPLNPCERDPEWKVVKSPEGSQAQIFQNSLNQGRFTPDLPGEYQFQSSQYPDIQWILGVVPTQDQPFENLNYYPSQSLTTQEGVAWTADVFRPTVTKVDLGSFRPMVQIAVGSWPVAVKGVPGKSLTLVLQRGTDSLGFINTSRDILEDSIYVGDEPSQLEISEDGMLAYINLATENALVVVDLTKKEVVRKVVTLRDPLGLSLSKNYVVVASHRSGQSQRPPFDPRSPESDRDILILDRASLKPIQVLNEVGATIKAVLMDPDETTITVSQVRNDTSVPLGLPSSRSFVHEVVRLNWKTGERLASVDLSPKTPGSEPLISLQNLVRLDGKLFVLSEGNDKLVALDDANLTELWRKPAEGRPRSLVPFEGSLLVHGHQSLSLSKISSQGEELGKVTLGVDPRPVGIARGQSYFTGAGKSYGKTWSCNSCHADGLTDTLVWNAGPVKDTFVSKPFFWLDGTYSLGWQGYLSNIRNYAFTVNGNIGVVPTTQEASDLKDYLASLMPPPASNGFTLKDGQLSDQAKLGEEIFEGKAGCAGCHGGPLFTSRQVLNLGEPSGKADVPSLVGIYRHGVWYKTGDKPTLESAVESMLKLSGASLNSTESDALNRYLKELTNRDFFLLSSEPRDPSARAIDTNADVSSFDPVPLPIDGKVSLHFSKAVYNGAGNLTKVYLEEGPDFQTTLPIDVQISQNHMVIKAKSDLAFDKRFRVRVAAGFESFDEVKTKSGMEVYFQTPKAPPKLKLEGKYVIQYQLPKLVFNTKGNYFDRNQLVKSPVTFEATPNASGSVIQLQYTPTLTYDSYVVIQESEAWTPPLPVIVGPGSFADGFSGMKAPLQDKNGDGVADFAQGEFSFSGPGFRFDKLPFELNRVEP